MMGKDSVRPGRKPLVLSALAATLAVGVAVVSTEGCSPAVAAPLTGGAVPASAQASGRMARESVNAAIERIADKILSLPTPKEPALTPAFSKTFTFGLKDDREVTVLKLRIGYAILKNLEFKQGEKLLNARLRSDAIVKEELADYGIKNPKAGTVQALEAYAWGMTSALFVGLEKRSNGSVKPFPFDPKTKANGYIAVGENSMLYAQQMLNCPAPYGSCSDHAFFVNGGLDIRGDFSFDESTDNIRYLTPNSRYDNHAFTTVPLVTNGEATPTWNSSKGGDAEGGEADKKLYAKNSPKTLPFWIDASWVYVPNEVRFTPPQERNDRELLALVAGAMDDILPHNEKLLKLFWSHRVAMGPFYEGDFNYPYAKPRKTVIATDLMPSKPIFDVLENIWKYL